MSVQVEVGANTRQAQQQIQDFAKSSRIALTNLSLVIQDLPFGFIGIQNNLPFVIKSFQELSKESGGVGNALKSLGSQLIGPGGLFFAFSAVTTGLTLLTQQYGSLSNAANILLGIQKSQKQVLEDYNKELDKSVSNERVEVANLESLSNILTSTNSSQTQRVGAYNMLNKSFPDLLKGLEREKVLSGEVNGEINKRIGLITTQIRLEGQRNAIIKLLDEATTNYVRSLRNAENQDFLSGLGNTIRGLLSGDLNPFSQKLTGVALGIGSAYKETKFWTDRLIELNNSLTDVNGQVAKFTTNIDNQTNKVKSNNKDLKEYQETYKQLIGFFKPQKTAQILVPNVGGPMANNLRSPFLPDAEDIKLFEDYYKQINQIIQDKTQSIAASIRRGIQQPLTEIFDMLLTKGKFSWQSFGNAVIDVLKRIAVQLTATAIAGAIANILAPGAGAAVGGLLKGISTSALGDYLGDFGGSANLSGISSGMGMSGQVVFVQRGTDLVGVLNRTNTNINRIG